MYNNADTLITDGNIQTTPTRQSNPNLTVTLTLTLTCLTLTVTLFLKDSGTSMKISGIIWGFM